jgi:hypothetical protein
VLPLRVALHLHIEIARVRQLALGNDPRPTLELAALLTALALGVANHRRRRHQRWIEYRLVEGLWRKRQALARIGLVVCSVSGPRDDGQYCTADRTGGNDSAPRRWVSWLFTAAMWGIASACGSPQRR